MTEPTTISLGKHSADLSLFRVRRTIRTGSSGAIVRILQRDDGSLLAIKAARDPRVPAVQQKLARDLIAPYFGDRMPAVLFAGQVSGTDILISECPSPNSLADVISSDGFSRTVVSAWTDAVTTLSTVWERSARSGFALSRAARNHQLRWQRAMDGLNFTFRHLLPSADLTQHIIIDDNELGTLRSALEYLAHVPPPTIHVACQGDPQPRNILLDDTGKWHLVDWEWAGLHHDWRMMSSHLIGWWHVENLLAHAHGQARAAGSSLTLSYRLPPAAIPAHCMTPVARSFHRMSTFGDIERDLIALALHVAMLLLREIPRVAATGNGHLLAPLLGESVKLIHSARTTQWHQIIMPVVPQR